MGARIVLIARDKSRGKVTLARLHEKAPDLAPTEGYYAGTFCTIAFQEGPGYKFSSASFSKAPPHGVLAKTGATSFAYRPFDGYRGPDSYSLRLCATVRGKNGCSTLTYRVGVR
jgi:hypothetical protein